MSAVTLRLENGVAEITIDRPEKRNALRDTDVTELRSTLCDTVAGGARALLLRGEGPAFCSGRDLSAADPGTEDGGAILRDVVNPLMAELAGLPLPTIAAVQGACLGSGLGLALACDLLIVADDARIGSPFARIGAVLDSAAHLWLAERLGTHRALELVYTGRMLSGREAVAWGLANRSVAATELLGQARSLAARIAAGPTTAFRLSKDVMRRIRDERPALTDVLEAEAVAQSTASATADYTEGISAFVTKRTPRFTGH
ncbi:MAG: enoyl-CoA hydratase/isomerase family protein [Actinoallomurus sp.]